VSVGQSTTDALPADVVMFKESRDICDHFRGEDPYDAKRAAEIARNLERHCHGTDARLAALRKKYASQPQVMSALEGYEANIE